MDRVEAARFLGAVEVGVAGRPIDGEVESGDLHVIVPTSQGALLAVIDGLGHGPEAASAARAAAAAVGRHASASLGQIFRACHQEMRLTRGAAISLAALDAARSELTWSGIGNVEGVIFRAAVRGEKREWLLLRGGVVGHTLPKVVEGTLSLGNGDTLVLVTDGIRSEHAEFSPVGRHPQEAADDILRHYRRGTDDALVVVARLRANS
jgi:serine phosphatase RsbU (regulator of sigma subunit)